MLLGSTTPRIFTPPLVTGPPGPCGCGCALTPATSLGFSATDFGTDLASMRPLPWQRWLFIHALELRPDGRFRYRTVLLLVARQNGKTTIVEVKNLWKMYVLRVSLVVGTAQNLDISEESWDRAVDIAESDPELLTEIAAVDRTNGKKALKLLAQVDQVTGKKEKSGPRWKIAAASRKGGRGLSGAEDVNLDELREHQNWDSWAAVTKTTMARENAQIWAFSNAGDDKSIVLNELQKKGRAAAEHPHLADTTLGYFEWSAPEDVKCTCKRPDDIHLQDCRLWDRTAWAAANPSLGYTITEEAISSALGTDPVAIFRTEVLCQRVDNLVETWQVISEQRWLDRLDSDSQLVGTVALAVDVSPTRSHAAISAAGRRPDADRHMEVTDHREGTGWVVRRVKQICTRQPVCAVVVDGAGAASLIPDLERELEPLGIKVHKLGAQEAAAAFGAFYDGFVPPGERGDDLDVDEEDADVEVDPTAIWHLDQPSLSLALAGALKRKLAGGSAWDRTDIDVDITPLVSATNALYGHSRYGHVTHTVELEGSLMA